MQAHIKAILEAVGENPDRQGLQETPRRVEQSLRYLTRGYQMNLTELINGALYDSPLDEMVIIKDIELFSLCEHHLLPFHGKCHIGYIPNGKVLGLSKFARIVDMFSARLQIQERLTQEIADTIAEITGARGIGVIIEAKHLCMMMRGVEKQNSCMTTSVMLGLFRNRDRTRQEFLRLIKG